MTFANPAGERVPVTARARVDGGSGEPIPGEPSVLDGCVVPPGDAVFVTECLSFPERLGATLGGWIAPPCTERSRR